MCLLALFYRTVDDAPIIVGANREEYYARGGEPPRLLEGPARIAAGVDPVSGGTWLGVNEHGLVVAVTNRPREMMEPPQRSRGSLVRDLLACPDSAQAAASAIKELDTGKYAGCNLLCVDNNRAVLIHAGDWLRVRYLPPGLHVLSNGDVNDGSDPRVLHVGGWLAQSHFQSGNQCIEALREVCSHHQPENPPVCFSHGERGTVSSSIILLRGDPRPRMADGVYLHAHGSPDRTPYEDYSEVLRQLA